MKIAYMQPNNGSVFEDYGIKNCCFKQLLNNVDMENATKKEHHHTGFEIHIIENGHQTYRINDKEYKAESRQMLFIPPNIRHCVKGHAAYTVKSSITFCIDNESVLAPVFAELKNEILLTVTDRIFENIKYIAAESKKTLSFSARITENRVFETVVLILRQCGFKEAALTENKIGEDTRFSIAKQYIKDNIEYNLKVSDVAEYCYLGTKQLTRLFREYEDNTPAAYIRERKIGHIEKLLSETELSLREISEKMSFANEYHFNSFFKKYAGMTPREYRRMTK